jgi:pyridoxamine 5'-phosphate oxidase
VGGGKVNPQDLPENPLELFRIWFDEAAESAEMENPNAMAVATVDAQNRPSCRMVLLKGVTDEGFHFYTNYDSRKGREIAGNPFVAATLYWDRLHRQVRIYGKAEKISRQASQEYFSSRARGSQLGAWASPQSQEVASRDFLERRVAEIEANFADSENILVPEHWGGYLIRPDRIEFWQQGANRLHDRCEYVLENQKWKRRRLAP